MRQLNGRKPTDVERVPNMTPARYGVRPGGNRLPVERAFPMPGQTVNARFLERQAETVYVPRDRAEYISLRRFVLFLVAAFAVLGIIIFGLVAWF